MSVKFNSRFQEGDRRYVPGPLQQMKQIPINIKIKILHIEQEQPKEEA